MAIRQNNPGDLDILAAIGRHGLLLPKELCAITGRSYKSIINRTALLKEASYIRWPDTQATNKAAWLSFPKAFQLTSKGVAKLMELGCEHRQPESSKKFLHQLTEAQVSASFEIGARDRLVSRREIIKDKPAHFPVAFYFKGKDYKHKLTPDIGPIGISYHGDKYRFLVVEVDLSSEPLASANRDRQAIETKIAGYLTVLEQGIYETHFGITNLSILFTTTTETRLANILTLCGEMAGRFVNKFGGMVVPTIISGKQPPPGFASGVWLQPHGKALNLMEM